jgi:hypothetical protein
MIYKYEAAEVTDIGQAQEIILGSPKDMTYTAQDSPGQLPRLEDVVDDE